MKLSPPVLAAAAALFLAAAASASAAEYVQGEVLVGHAASASSGNAHSAEVVKTLPGESVRAAAKRLRRDHGVSYAVPNYIAHATAFIPNDPGATATLGDWQNLQWNFAGPYGIDAPDAWSQAIAMG